MRDQGRAPVILFRSGGGPAVSLGGQCRAQIVDGGLHRLQIDRRCRESGVVGEAGDNSPGHGNRLFSGLFHEPARHADVVRHRSPFE